MSKNYNDLKNQDRAVKGVLATIIGAAVLAIGKHIKDSEENAKNQRHNDAIDRKIVELKNDPLWRWTKKDEIDALNNKKR